MIYSKIDLEIDERKKVPNDFRLPRVSEEENFNNRTEIFHPLYQTHGGTNKKKKREKNNKF